MARFAEARVRRYLPNAFTLEWELASINQTDPIEIFIERSESPEGPWSATPKSVTGSTYHHDYRVPTSNQYRRFYYRLWGLDDGTRFESDAITLRNPADAPVRYMIKQSLMLLKHRCGYPVLFLLRRQWGAPCAQCGRRGSATSSFCTGCYSTGFAGGYWDPIQGYAARAAKMESAQITPGMVLEADVRTFWTSAFPELRESDIMVDSENRRWKISGPIRVTYKLEYPMRQTFSAKQLPTSDVVYRFPVDQLWDLEIVAGRHVWVERTNAPGD